MMRVSEPLAAKIIETLVNGLQEHHVGPAGQRGVVAEQVIRLMIEWFEKKYARQFTR